MNKWELPKEPQFYNWESPITKVFSDIQNQILKQDEENTMFAIKQAIGYEVDKEELIKALQYDREQYDKGYRDGVREAFKAELEEIKAELEKPKVIGMDFFDGLYYAEEIIDKHISELKGE